MKHLAILSSSVRAGDRMSHRVALFLKQYIEQNNLATAEIWDLKAYNFPLFDERLAFQKEPSEGLLDFTQRFNAADGLIIVSPVYNGSFPASLKNVIDLYYKEWKRKIVAVSSVTMGAVPALMTVKEIQAILLKMGALVSPIPFTVINAPKEFNEKGMVLNKDQTQKLISPFIEEFMWIMNQVAE